MANATVKNLAQPVPPPPEYEYTLTLDHEEANALNSLLYKHLTVLVLDENKPLRGIMFALRQVGQAHFDNKDLNRVGSSILKTIGG